MLIIQKIANFESERSIVLQYVLSRKVESKVSNVLNDKEEVLLFNI